MGQGVAILIHHELASVVDEDLETLGERLQARQVELEKRASALSQAEDDLQRRQRDLEVREARVRERELKKRETNVAVVERRLAKHSDSLNQQAAKSRRKLGRNEPCWCKSGKKFKYCHGAA
jgi:preprotein translocase subunit SecA